MVREEDARDIDRWAERMAPGQDNSPLCDRCHHLFDDHDGLMKVPLMDAAWKCRNCAQCCREMGIPWGDAA